MVDVAEKEGDSSSGNDEGSFLAHDLAGE